MFYSFAVFGVVEEEMPKNQADPRIQIMSL
jgi:hypothetical protein